MKNKWFFLVAAIIIVVITYLIGSGVSKDSSLKESKNSKIQIVTSFYPLYFLTSQIVKDKADVLNITPSGAEPHDYEPTAQNIARIEKSDLLVLNGGKLEAWGDKIKTDLQGKNVTIITVGENLVNQHIEEEGKTIPDPHVWLSPNLAITMANNITMALIKIDPINENYYTKNYAVLSEKLDKLDKEYQKGLSTCQKRDFVTSHAAFGYLAKHYDINQVAISGISPDEEPSSQQLAEVADFAKKNNVKYIFFESLVSPKLSETVAQEVGAKTLVLDPIEGVNNEDMKAGRNYFTIMRDNLTNLRLALQCSK